MLRSDQETKIPRSVADPDSQNAAELAILTYILLKTTVAMFHLKLMIFQKNISFVQVVHVEVL